MLKKKTKGGVKCPPVSGENYSRTRFTVRPMKGTKENGGTRLGKPFKKIKCIFGSFWSYKDKLKIIQCSDLIFFFFLLTFIIAFACVVIQTGRSTSIKKGIFCSHFETFRTLFVSAFWRLS